jgi:hypothetical protein
VGALAPLSLVQAALAGGLIFLGVIAERWFGFDLGKREWIGVGLAATRSSHPHALGAFRP